MTKIFWKKILFYYFFKVNWKNCSYRLTILSLFLKNFVKKLKEKKNNIKKKYIYFLKLPFVSDSPVQGVESRPHNKGK